MSDVRANPFDLSLLVPPNMDFGGTERSRSNDDVLGVSEAVTPCKSLLSVLMKTSFSMSSLRDGSAADTEASSMSSPATLPRRKRRDGRRRHGTPTQRHRRHNFDQSQLWPSQPQLQLQQQSPVEKKDEFWEALQSNYDYLMDGGLIETCKEANGELSWDEEDLEVPCTWTFKEFLDRHSELNDWLESLRAALDRNVDVASVDEQPHVNVHPEETKYRSSQMKLFNEQSRRLERRYPNMRDEVLSRTDQLNARWTELEGALALATDDGDDKDELTVLKGEIARQIRWLRKWLREVDQQIGPLTLSHEWSNGDIWARLKQQQALQREIESRCKCVLAVVKLCEKFRRRHDEESATSTSPSVILAKDQQRRPSTANNRSTSIAQSSSSSPSLEVSGSGSKTKRKKGDGEKDQQPPAAKQEEDEDGLRIKRIRGQRGSDHTVRVAQNLQRRFHALWIRSLEWQCWLEGLLGSTASAQRHRQVWKDCRSPGDEPRRKYPRLGGAFHPRGSGMVVPEATSASAGATAATVDSSSARDKDPAMTSGLGRGVSIRGHDHHDVGYSSESSAHLSNEESAGEFVRVYTYTTAEATTPRVLEVVVDGERRPRKTPPREMALMEAANSASADDQVSTPSVENAGSNCGTFYFCHEDSDGADGKRLSSRAKLDFGSSPVVAGPPVEKSNGAVHHSSSPSSSSSSSSSEADEAGHGGGGTGVADAARIHRLVKQAELLVKPPYNLVDGCDRRSSTMACPGGHRRRTTDGSSCDASGEYTTSSGSESDVAPDSRNSGSVVMSSTSSSTSSCEDNANGSVIHLQKRGLLASDPLATPPTEGQNSGGSDPGAGSAVASVRLRLRKKRANRDWRLSSGSIDSSSQCVDAKRLELSSLSEGALNVPLEDSAKVTSTTTMMVFKTDGSQRKFTRTRRLSREHHQHYQQQSRSRRRHQVEFTSKCRSLISLRHSGSSDSGRWKCVDALPSGVSTSTASEEDDEGTLLVDESSVAATAAAAKDMACLHQQPPFLAVVQGIGIDDFSSMSEQAWDDYQDPPYLSDAYSEKALDGEDASVRRLLEFGDDYRAYMESGNASDGTSTPGLPPIAPTDILGIVRSNGLVSNCPTTAVEASARIRGDDQQQKQHQPILDSESDLDDLSDVVKRHRQQLDITRQRLRALVTIDDLSHPHVARQLSSGTGEVLATCDTHIRCLDKVWAQLTSTELVVLPSDVSAGVRRTGEKLRDDWRTVLMESREFQRQLCQLGRLQNEVTQLRENVEALQAKLDDQKAKITMLEGRAELDILLLALKASGEGLQELKLSMSRTNFNVHAFASQTGRDVVYLNADVIELYRMWDRSNERLQNDLIKLAKLEIIWDDYEARRTNILKIKLPKMVAGEITGGHKVDLEADLAAFRGAATLLKISLESSPARETIDCESKRVVEQVYAVLFGSASVESATSLCAKESSSSKSRTFESADADIKTESTKEADKADETKRFAGGSSPRSLLWRVLRAAVPFQLTLVVLFCLACFLEPHCCDNLNRHEPISFLSILN